MPQLLDKSIEILSVKHLRGPNMWTYYPVIEVWLDIGDLEDYPSNLIPGFYDRLVKALPSLQEHRCSYGEPGGFLKRVEEGTWPAHILEHLTLELQNLAGIPGGFGKARDGDRRGVYKVMVSANNEEVTLTALKYARDLYLALAQDTQDPQELGRLDRPAQGQRRRDGRGRRTVPSSVQHLAEHELKPRTSCPERAGWPRGYHPRPDD
jgi:cyanophycin synthetase